VIGTDGVFTAQSKRLAALAMHHGVPTIYQYQEFVAAPDRVAVRTLLGTVSAHMHIVTLDGFRINTVSDLKGKRVSTGLTGMRNGNQGAACTPNPRCDAR